MNVWPILLALLAQDPALIEHTKIVNIEADPATVKPGQEFTLTFTVRIDPEWHIYSTTEKGSPTAWKFDPPVEPAGSPVEPKLTNHRKDMGNGQFLDEAYHEGEVKFRVPVRLAQNALPGTLKIKGAMTGMECDPRMCIGFEYPFEGLVTVAGGVTTPPPVEGHTTIEEVKVEPPTAKAGEQVRLVFKIAIEKNWHIYGVNDQQNPTRWEFDVSSPVELAGDVEEPALKHKKTPLGKDDEGKDEFLEEWYHEGGVTFRVPVKVIAGAKPGPVKFAGRMLGQECSNVCIDLEVPFEAGFTVIEGGAVAPAPPLTTTQEPEPQEEPQSFLGLVFLGVLGGLLSLIMPCVYPLLPVTLTYFIKQGGESHAKSVAMTTAYALGIMVVFTGAGFLFSILMGADGPRIFAASPWVNLGVGLLFFWFAFSLLGLYEINLPSWMTGSFTSQQRSGVGGAFILGALFSVVTFTCTIPIAATILAVSATSGIENKFTGLVAMLVYSATMAAPFVVLGMFPSLIKDVPKSGGWLQTVKVSAGFAELALALMYFAVADQVSDVGILTRPVMVAVWVAVLGMMSFYLLGLFRMRDDGPPAPVGVGRLLFALTFGVMAVFMGSGLNSKTLGGLDILLPVAPPEEIGNYPDALEEARRTRKPIFLEFTGFS